MKRHSNFDALRAAINAEAVTSFDDLWRYISPRDLFKRAGINPYKPALRRLFDPRLLTIHQSDRLAGAIGVTGAQFFSLIVSSLVS
jgi:hypothetical protein